MRTVNETTRRRRAVLAAPAPGAVTNIGHRGAAASAPENTLASAELAIAHPWAMASWS
jgi:glycerophosphoryl diester phosphodiesterase